MASEKELTQKTKKQSFQTLRGMKDILAEDWLYYDFILQNAKKIFEFYGFKRIETPLLEEAELFTKGVGKKTEIVGKEMYLLKTKVEQKFLALRPEGTAPIVRAYIEKGMFNLPQPIKLYYFGSFFRHEKPQAGRYRQFYQFGAEIIGEDDIASEVKIIMLSKIFLESLGFAKKDIFLLLNSIGCSKCRTVYIRELKKYYRKNDKQICSDCRRRIKENPLRVLDCKNEKCYSVKEGAPFILDYLCTECNNHFKSLLEYLEYLNIPYILDKTLVRGLDYYTRTVFEFCLDDEKNKVSLGGGGRYDKLAEIVGRVKKPGVGVAFGVERLMEEMIQQGKGFKLTKPEVFLVYIGEAAKKMSFKILEQFRKEKILIGENLEKSNLRAQLKNADRLGVKYVFMFGQQEVLDEMIILKDMDSGLQELIPLDKIIPEIKKRLKNRK
ncbi:MAG: histidine--tRNA ligase [Candidatus Pacebacteria bacterium]|nr:histidine--tRNA ligase [Candidatus Paceibacterota bacterium]MDD5722020.1 histidine--tRNA ligase [Candidatus Paceibacterota bacterium]